MSIMDIIEQSQERMEAVQIPNFGLLSDYAYGRCHIFALALHLELGYEMEFMWDMDYYVEGGDTSTMVLAHAYGVLPKDQSDKGCYVDARGIISKYLILYDYEYNAERFEIVSQAQLEQYFAEEFLAKPEQGELETLRAYIRENIADYT